MDTRHGGANKYLTDDRVERSRAGVDSMRSMLRDVRFEARGARFQINCQGIRET
jgi:hypothetical protein